jgi:hypothetical protein
MLTPKVTSEADDHTTRYAGRGVRRSTQRFRCQRSGGDPGDPAPLGASVVALSITAPEPYTTQLRRHRWPAPSGGSVQRIAFIRRCAALVPTITVASAADKRYSLEAER